MGHSPQRCLWKGEGMRLRGGKRTSTGNGLAAGSAVPDTDVGALDGNLAAEGAVVLGVLGDFHLLHLLTQGSTVSDRKLLVLGCVGLGAVQVVGRAEGVAFGVVAGCGNRPRCFALSTTTRRPPPCPSWNSIVVSEWSSGAGCIYLVPYLPVTPTFLVPIAVC